MDALAVWLKQIIIVVLLATFIDLLLPNRSMQRYVKLVVSLFILMTILSPVMSLLGSNANMRMLTAAVEGWDLSGAPENSAFGTGEVSGSGSGASRSGSIPALSEVLSAGQAIEAEQREKSLELLALKLESMVKEQIESQYEVSVIRADAALSLDKDRYPVVEKLTVVVGRPVEAALSRESGGEGNWTMEPIKPVDPVDIRFGTDSGTGSSVVPADAEAEHIPLPDAQRIRREIAKSLSTQWNIEERKVVVMNG